MNVLWIVWKLKGLMVEFVEIQMNVQIVPWYKILFVIKKGKYMKTFVFYNVEEKNKMWYVNRICVHVMI